MSKSAWWLCALRTVLLFGLLSTPTVHTTILSALLERGGRLFDELSWKTAARVYASANRIGIGRTKDEEASIEVGLLTTQLRSQPMDVVAANLERLRAATEVSLATRRRASILLATLLERHDPERSLHVWEEVRQSNPGKFWDVWASAEIARRYRALGNVAKYFDMMPKALRDFKQMNDDYAYRDTLTHLAWSYAWVGRTQEAIALCSENDDLVAKLCLVRAHLRDAELAATFDQRLQHVRLAQVLIAKAIPVLRSDERPYWESELARASYFRRDLRGALRLISMAEKGYRQIGADDGLLDLNVLKAKAAEEVGEFGLAQRTFQTALDESLRRNPRHPGVQTLLTDYASFLIGRGRANEAKPLLHEALGRALKTSTTVGSPWLRAYFLNKYDQLFALAIDLQMTEAHPDAQRLYSLMESSRGAAFRGFAGSGTDATVLSLQRSLWWGQLNTDQRRQTTDALLKAEHSALPTWNLPAGSNTQQTLGQLQASLVGDDLIVSYVLGDRRAGALLIDRARVRIVNLGSSQRIGQVAQRLASLLPQGREAECQRFASELARLVVQPLGLLPKRVTIIPHGPLHAIPFEFLPLGRRPLLDEHIISYAPSAGLLKSTPNPQAPTVLSASASPSSMPALPHALVEAEMVAATLGGTPLAQATEAAFLTALRHNVAIIHFAGHSVADPIYPNRTALVFASPTATDDGLLQAADISRAPITAQLVVLNACDTAAGLRGHEGVVSLVRPFLEKQTVRSVAGALWPLSDGAAFELMRCFYAGLAQGHDVGASLASAKKQLLAGRPGLAPRYWASLVLYGNSRLAFLPDGKRRLPKLRRQEPIDDLVLRATAGH